MDRTSVPALAFRKERHKRLCRHLRNRTAQPSTEGRPYDSTARSRGLRDNRAPGFLFFYKANKQGKQAADDTKRKTKDDQPHTGRTIRSTSRRPLQRYGMHFWGSMP